MSRRGVKERSRPNCSRRRQAIDPARRRRLGSAALSTQESARPCWRRACRRRSSFYWPFRGEFDARPLVRDLLEQGLARGAAGRGSRKGAAAISPVDARRGDGRRHLEYPGAARRRGRGAGRSAGAGGRFRRQKLSARLWRRLFRSHARRRCRPVPLRSRLAFEFSRLDTIYPQPFDQRFDVVVTEAAVRR